MAKRLIEDVDEIVAMLRHLLKPRVHYTTVATFKAVEEQGMDILIDRGAGRKALKKLKAAGLVTGGFHDSGHWMLPEDGR